MGACPNNSNECPQKSYPHAHRLLLVVSFLGETKSTGFGIDRVHLARRPRLSRRFHLNRRQPFGDRGGRHGVELAQIAALGSETLDRSGVGGRWWVGVGTLLKHELVMKVFLQNLGSLQAFRGNSGWISEGIQIDMLVCPCTLNRLQSHIELGVYMSQTL